MKRAFAIILLVSASADAKPHPKIKHVFATIGHVLKIGGEVAIVGLVIAALASAKQ